ncbi:MAG: type II toxin-antitoxin system RelE/ParE family toxin [Janthinobacterium lividum]
MSKNPRFSLYLAGPARRDIAAIDRYTLRTFGEAAADRYDILIRQALRDIQEDPDRPGARARPGALNPTFRLYHLSSSRDRVSGQPVKEPRHFIVYRQRPDDVIEVLRVLHDSRDLARHLPDA